MLFPNEVHYEASTEVDGITISVKERAQYMSEISFEDAWYKAHELAKQKAEAKLEEVLEKIKKEKDLDIVQIKGCPGPRGYPGPRGPGAQGATMTKVILNGSPLGRDLSRSNGNSTDVVIQNSTSTTFTTIAFPDGFVPAPGSTYTLNISFAYQRNLGDLLYLKTRQVTPVDVDPADTFYSINLTGVLYNALSSNQGPGTATNNTIYIGNGTLGWSGMYSFVFDGENFVGNSPTTNPSPSAVYTTQINATDINATNNINATGINAANINSTYSIYQQGPNGQLLQMVNGSIYQRGPSGTELVIANGAINATTISATDSISAPTINATDSISAPTISATESISAPTINATTINATNINATNAINANTISATGGIAQFSQSGQVEIINGQITQQSQSGQEVLIANGAIIQYSPSGQVEIMNGAIYATGIVTAKDFITSP